MSIHNILASRGNILHGNSYTGVTDSAPYLFRPTGGNTAIGDAKVAFLNKLVGGTVAWNQLVKNGNFTSVADWSTYGASYTVSNNEATITSGANTYRGIYQDVNVPTGHYFLCRATCKVGTASAGRIIATGGSGFTRQFTSSSYQTIEVIATMTSDESLRLSIQSIDADSTIIVKNVQVIDLTAAFQTAIAAYARTCEQSTLGSGIAWLKSYGFFTKPYYAYNAGTLESVYTNSHKEYGFNQWDEEWEVGSINNATGQNEADLVNIRSKNYNRALPNFVYYICGPADKNINVYWYDGDKAFISYNSIRNYVVTSPINAMYFKIRTTSSYGTTYNNDICINVSKPTGTPKNGDYVPHTEVTYPITPNVLRGKLGLDANNNITYNGDERYPNGTIKRNYGVRAYEAGDESLADAITDGTNTVYKLTTPTTETTDPYTNPQTVFVGGTEEFTDYGVAQGQRDVAIPVGHKTEYYQKAV